MASEILIFDATGSNPDGTDPGAVLEVGPNDDLRLQEFDAPAPQQTVQYAGSVDTEGGVPSSRKHENRVINLKLMCMTAASLRSLQGKVGKLAREGGTLKWILPNAETVIFDVLAADTFVPSINKLYYVRTGAFTEVQVMLLAKPYGRGPSVSATLSASTATANRPFIFTVTGVKGDMWALGTLQIGNVTTGKRWLTWGVRSRYYAAADAPLYLEAESQTASGATLNAGYSGASGGGANKVMRHSNIGMSGPDSSFSVLTSKHIGSYRIFARVQADSGNGGPVSIRADWTRDLASASVVGDWVPIVDEFDAPIQGDWVLVDLGMVTLPKARFGTQGWTLDLIAMSTNGTDDLDWDWVAIVPVSEGSGTMYTGGTFSVNPSGVVAVAYDAVMVRDASTNWSTPAQYEGDYLLIPPAGAEGRTAEFVVIFTGLLASTDTVIDASNMEAVTATLSYVPRYLVVPEP